MTPARSKPRRREDADGPIEYGLVVTGFLPGTDVADAMRRMLRAPDLTPAQVQRKLARLIQKERVIRKGMTSEREATAKVRSMQDRYGVVTRIVRVSSDPDSGAPKHHSRPSRHRFAVAFAFATTMLLLGILWGTLGIRAVKPASAPQRPPSPSQGGVVTELRAPSLSVEAPSTLSAAQISRHIVSGGVVCLSPEAVPATASVRQDSSPDRPLPSGCFRTQRDGALALQTPSQAAAAHEIAEIQIGHSTAYIRRGDLR
jgi:hypothetical protein